MKTASPKTSPADREAPPSFTWRVRSTDITFTRIGDAEATEGSASDCQDCSTIAPFDQPRPRRPVRGGGAGGSP